MKLTKLQWTALFYFLFLFVVWAGVELGLMPLFEAELGESSTAVFLLKEGLLKILFWVVPPVLLLRHSGQEVHIPLREMFTNRFNLLHAGLLLAAISAYLIGSHLLREHTLHFHFTWRLLGFILVGITEEIAFRGYILNALYNDNTQKYMLEVNAVLFLCIHFPVWISEGTFVSAFAGLGFLSILALGMIFAWSFVHFRNIWVPVILHTVYDVLVTALN